MNKRLPEWRYILRRCVVLAVIIIAMTVIWNVTNTAGCSVYGCSTPVATLPVTK